MIRAAVAQSWGAAVAKACKQPFPDCTRCRRPQSEPLRVTWGCDSPAPHIVWESTCPKCAGSRPDCPRCEGRGEVGHDQCPNALIRNSSTSVQIKLDLLMRSYAHYDSRIVLPVEGAWLDQSRSFLACIDLIDSEKGYWENLRQEHTEREIQRAEAARAASAAKGRRR